ncbi:hypothetical protein [Mucilaginibacter sp.]|uniref:hypothetical protein n=1 Tax=Mucilaginibacter sp. TaxID=1882438 RepID=UPI00261211BF|nr:hypothetical protein [Mucilaginibacter sp.]MDB5030330.1 hypothetical protein [Mucilaginibacter sp.]
MKTVAQSRLDKKNIGTKKTSLHEEIKTDVPLSEKDEVKKAEKKLGDSQKKNG